MGNRNEDAHQQFTLFPDSIASKMWILSHVPVNYAYILSTGEGLREFLSWSSAGGEGTTTKLVQFFVNHLHILHGHFWL